METKADRLQIIAEQMLSQLPMFVQPLARPYLQQLSNSSNKEEVAEALVLKARQLLDFVEFGYEYDEIINN